jgi:hypothetical protein
MWEGVCLRGKRRRQRGRQLAAVALVRSVNSAFAQLEGGTYLATMWRDVVVLAFVIDLRGGERW